MHYSNHASTGKVDGLIYSFILRQDDYPSIFLTVLPGLPLVWCSLFNHILNIQGTITLATDSKNILQQYITKTGVIRVLYKL